MEELPTSSVLTLLQTYWPVLAIFLATLFALLVSKLFLGEEEGPPYEKRPSLLTQSELRFYGVLQDAVEDEWMICAMVRMADLIKVRPKTPQYQAWVNRILAKHIDFVLCDPESLEALLAVELDDPSHQRADRIERDAFVDEAMAAARLPLLRVPTSSDYDPGELRKSIESLI